MVRFNSRRHFLGHSTRCARLSRVRHRMRFLFHLLVAMQTAQLASAQLDSDFQNELRSESAKTGLALAGIRDQSVAVIPFDGRDRYFTAPHALSLVAFGKAGTTIVWSLLGWSEPTKISFETVK